MRQKVEQWLPGEGESARTAGGHRVGGVITMLRSCTGPEYAKASEHLYYVFAYARIHVFLHSLVPRPFFQSSPEDMCTDLERGEGRERETPIGCLPYVLLPGTEPTT